MTQKDKIREALMFATKVKSMANSLKRDARDFDVKFPLRTAELMEEEANNLIKKLNSK